MADDTLKVYEVEIDGIKTNLKLDAEGAKRYGVTGGRAVEVRTTASERKAAQVSRVAAKKETATAKKETAKSEKAPA